MRINAVKLAVFTGILVLAGFGCNGITAEQTVENAKQKLASEQKFAYEFRFTGDPSILDDQSNTSLQTVMPGAQAFTLELSGQVDRAAAQDELANQLGQFSMEVIGEETFRVAGEYRSVDGVNYLNLSSAEMAGGDQLPFDLNDLLNTWIALPGGFGDGADPSRLMAGSTTDDEWTEEQVQAAVEAFNDFSLFSSAEKRGRQEIRGINTTEYAVLFDEAGIQLFAEELSRIRGEAFSSVDQEKIKLQVKRFNQGNPRIWVGKDGLPYRLAAEPAFTDATGVERTAYITVDLYSYGEVQEVTAPAESVSVEAAFSGMFEGALGNLFTPPADPTQNMQFSDPSEFLKNLEGGQMVDPAELEKAMKALQGS